MQQPLKYLGIMVETEPLRKKILKPYVLSNSTPMKLYSFTPLSIHWRTGLVRGLEYIAGTWRERMFPFPHVVYNRCYNRESLLFKRIEQVIGKGRCFNHTNYWNKMDMIRFLSQSLPDHIPETYVYRPQDLLMLSEKHPLMFFKPSYGSKGTGVYRSERKPEGSYWVGLHYNRPMAVLEQQTEWVVYLESLIGSKSYIVQKGISSISHPSLRIFDIRALLQKNRQGNWDLTNLISRIANEGSYNTSICDDIHPTAFWLRTFLTESSKNTVLHEILQIGMQTAHMLDSLGMGSGEFSIDFMLDEHLHPWIIELNGSPQKELYENMPERRIVYQRPVEYAAYLARSNG
ncbi:YheC/YheD family protein [Paenibacillus lemnae]|uniref:YheC/YheD family protein n=1 Tax=Paenibacillus lemnae TaxID=1330551 RepID=A0A848M6G9_PAELE|nr:YheC/YheD family protein [Paenibacillus lemnae]NMO95849.1 YheC/YheD family protein [Paenibacillus lemnae]